MAERVENADADMPEWRDRIDMPDAVDGGRSDEPWLESEYAELGRPLGIVSTDGFAVVGIRTAGPLTGGRACLILHQQRTS